MVQSTPLQDRGNLEGRECLQILIHKPWTLSHTSNYRFTIHLFHWNWKTRLPFLRKWWSYQAASEIMNSEAIWTARGAIRYYIVNSSRWISWPKGELIWVNILRLKGFNLPHPSTPAEGVHVWGWGVETNIWSRQTAAPWLILFLILWRGLRTNVNGQWSMQVHGKSRRGHWVAPSPSWDHKRLWTHG